MFNFDKFQVLIFDTETNGLTPKESVLAYSALSCDLFISAEEAYIFAVDHKVRYFHRRPDEDVNPHALAVHQLTEQRLKELRSEMDNSEMVPRHFDQAQNIFHQWASSAFDLVVGHNLSFDLRMTKIDPEELKGTFCTMKDGRPVYKELDPLLKGSVSLAKAAQLLEVDYNKEAKHDATVDTFVTAKVFKELLCFDSIRSLLRKDLLLSRNKTEVI